MKKFFVFIMISVFLIAKPINICDDSAQWPPFTFLDQNKKLKGLTIDILNEVFRRINKNYKMELIPWKRCLYLVKNYDKTNKYEMFVDGTYTKQRADDYYITMPIYSTHNVAWFSRNKFSKKEIKNIILHKPNTLRYCDVNGYQTEMYYKKLNLSKKIKIDQGAKTSCDVLKKISKNRCDVMIASKEGIIGYSVTGKCKIPKDIAYVDLPVFKETQFYMFISKKYPNAKKLLKAINKALQEMRNDGTYQKLQKKWLNKFH
ncbi:substrate-binding periplasmic protein [Nautilia lithotrophica]